MTTRTMTAVLLVALTAATASAQQYVPGVERDDRYDALGGTELVMAYFGSSTCGPCNMPEFKRTVEQAKLLLAAQAQQRGIAFVALGVALDSGVEAGLGYLQSSGAFDEIAVGRNWSNSAALAHLWRPDGIETRQIGQPMIIVLERDVEAGQYVSVRGVRYVGEWAGAERIPEWVQAGAPLE